MMTQTQTSKMSKQKPFLQDPKILHQSHLTKVFLVMKKTKVSSSINLLVGTLVKQKNPDKVFTGEGADKIGPGHYQMKDSFNILKGTNWHQSRTHRRSFTSGNTAPSLGPGCYNSDKTDIFPIYKYKPSSVFLSRVERLKGSKGKPPMPNSRKKPLLSGQHGNGPTKNHQVNVQA